MCNYFIYTASIKKLKEHCSSPLPLGKYLLVFFFGPIQGWVEKRNYLVVDPESTKVTKTS
jgi:hypothetical protein